MTSRLFCLIALLVVLNSGCLSQDASSTSFANNNAAKKEYVAPNVASIRVSYSQFGPIITDSRGMTLYAYQNDLDGKSSCLGQCAINWPPLLTDGEVKVAGNITGKLTAVRRSDGRMQASYVDMPLYFFSQDLVPGDAKGHGASGLWHVINPTTGPIIQKSGLMNETSNTEISAITTTITYLTEKTPSTPDSGGVFIAMISDVLPGSTFDFVYNGEKAILVNVNGAFFAFVNVCPHKGCPMKGGLSENVLTCTCHGAQFNPRTGDVIKGPAASPLRGIEIEVIKDSVFAKSSNS
jgi:predicted lipoprotein with Yx(FWY)xxD motif/nitrite reductase/ring-hydroxylating ferredoxin subunit